MGQFVDFAFEDGTSALVEISPVDAAGGDAAEDGQWEDDVPVRPVGAGSRVIQRSGQLLHDAFAPLAPILSGIHARAQEMSHAPDELSIEFGVKLTAGLKIAVVSGGEASFTVTATWNTSQGQRQPSAPAASPQPAAPVASGEGPQL
ncbi:CU044_2847 family protein [Streptomyces sp. NPDC058284]|uniref:CU044_2847 family protein n=1 Tax=unclassified Streptomyces TaxID=2593676 RepID=UPI003654BD2B